MPASQPKTNPAPAPKPLARVLAVEDHADIGELMQSALGRSLIEATVVRTGEEALLCLTTEPYDLLLLDIALPGISGLEVCRQIKASPPLKDIPVIFISGHATPENKAEAKRLGAAAFIEKPFGLLPFLSCIMGHLKLKTNAEQNAPLNVQQMWPVAMP